MRNSCFLENQLILQNFNFFMTTALQSPSGRRIARLQEASLLDGPMLLLNSIRGFRSNQTLTWLATVPLALMGLGVFGFAARAEVGLSDLKELKLRLSWQITFGYLLPPYSSYL